MADQQKPQEKKAWSTPEIVVLTRSSEPENGVLKACKGSDQGQSTYEHSCKKVMFTSCTNFCRQTTMV